MVRGRLLALALSPGLAVLARLAHRRHPGLFERLTGLERPVLALVPDELPLAILLRADPRRPVLEAVAKADLDTRRVAAVIRGPLRVLAQLADGRVDGDALFFSRRIVVEGSTEAAVALRNALDNAGLGGLAELALPPGRAAKLVGRALRLGGGLIERLHARRNRR
ncbi:MAG: hypothetical protein FJX46_14880 [Alphaproteobacteria bacterium]|nr:hypothetical protein [Alphaproteobacteria bacterium]